MNKNLELYIQFLNWLRIGHSLDTVSSYKWGLKVYLDWCDGVEKDILKFKENDFVDYASYLRDDRGVKRSTSGHYICALRTFWRWLYRQELVKFDDSYIPVPKDNDKEHYPYVVKQELDLILNYFDEFYSEQLRDKTIIAFLAATGLRLGEMLAMEIGQIDLDDKKATARTFKRTNHFREIYWDDETNRLLKNWLEVREKYMEKANFQSNALFISLARTKIGKPSCKSNVQKMIRKVRKNLGIKKKITAHSFRHGFGHKAVENQIHPRHLQIMLGHAKLNTTMFYMGVSNKEVEEIYRNKMESSLTRP
ncbi:MAG: tyrosine-type recombinase/integrase [Patescibacteria group bacterium]